MNKKITIEQKPSDILTLRSITKIDIEKLREWKNKNRKSFFYDKIINQEEQIKWFNKYLETSENFLFMIELDKSPIGCLGFKMVGEDADIYNVILGANEQKGKGVMSLALKILCSYIITLNVKKIYLKVLKTNSKAVNFYTKNLFSIKNEENNHYFMEFSKDKFKSIPIEIEGR